MPRRLRHRAAILARLLPLLSLLAALNPLVHAGEPAYTLQKIWDDNRYNAFTDITRFNDAWYVVFRDSTTHGIPPAGQQGGKVRVISSSDGTTWTTAALFSSSGDLRDPKISVTADNHLMVSAGDISQVNDSLQSKAWFSTDGSNWGSPQLMTGNSVADEWIWRVQWHGGTGYGIGYGATSGPIGEITTRLYSTTDGVNYAPLADPMCAVEQFANEVGITFLPDGRAVALVRRDWKAVASVGVSSGDYSTWTFQSSNYQVGGPQLLTLPDGRIVAGSRLYLSDDLHSALSWLDPATGALDPFLIFPSHPEGRSDTGYLGLYYHENEIWATYYVTGDAPIGASSDIYLARVSMPVPEPSTIALAGVAAVAAVGFRLARRVCRRGGR